MNFFLASSLLISFMTLTQAATNNILCYFESWAQYDPGNGKFGPKDVPSSQCTHLVYSFILPKEGGEIKKFNDAATLNALVDHKKQNSKLKVMASIGGWSAGSGVFSKIVADNGQRTHFVDALSSFIDLYKLDGIDIDWEYPAMRHGSSSHDNVNYISFLKELRAKLGNKKVISAAVGADKSFIGTTYNVAEMNKYLTFINLMTYDYHSAADGVTGQNSPLYASSVDSDKTLNADFAVNTWIKSGASPSKILLGLAFYGQTFKLSKSSSHGLGAKTVGAGPPGPYTQESGSLSYLEICENLKHDGWQTVFDSTQEAVYSSKGDQWVGYDNIDSIRAKCKYAIAKSLGGVMMWPVDSDDRHNICGEGSMPLLGAINSVIKH